MTQFLNSSLLGRRVHDYLPAVLIFAIELAALVPIKRTLAHRLPVVLLNVSRG